MNFKQNIPITLQVKHYDKLQASQPLMQVAIPSTTAFVNAELVLIRGLPASGKTTMASVLPMIGYKHFEADMFFEVGGVYLYDAKRIGEAHAWC